MTPLSGIIVTIDDVRADGICVRGARPWFASYGLDFRDFVKNGIPADIFLSTNDCRSESVFKRTLARLNITDPRNEAGG